MLVVVAVVVAAIAAAVVAGMAVAPPATSSSVRSTRCNIQIWYGTTIRLPVDTPPTSPSRPNGSENE
jgi:hypothetical protein